MLLLVSLKMTSPSSRITVQENPTALPGSCGLCGAADKEYYVDFKLDFEFYGVLYFCDECVAETARVCGFAKPEEVAAVLEKVSETTAENLYLKQKLRAAEAYIRESFDVDPSSVIGSSSESTPSEPDELDEEGIGEEGSDDSEADESADEQGPNDVRDFKPVAVTPNLSL